ncbi:hypothetical protein ACFSR6_22525 [Pedobacter vanadiisoli]|uniref:Natural product n=1 Tax=Pedobacter vanadiisoli TaxID=1761975 RepID=A0ABW5MS39_9SPHI
MKTLNLQSLSEPGAKQKKVEQFSISSICCDMRAVTCMCCCIQ